MEQYGPFAGGAAAHLSAPAFADFLIPCAVPAGSRHRAGGPLFHGLGYGPECHRAETINGTPA